MSSSSISSESSQSSSSASVPCKILSGICTLYPDVLSAENFTTSTELNEPYYAWQENLELYFDTWEDDPWVQVDLNVAKQVNYLFLYYHWDTDFAITGFELYGSNTGDFSGEETLIHSKSGIEWEEDPIGLPLEQTQEFEFGNDTAYRYYRVVITDTTIDQYCVLEWIGLKACYDESSSSSSASPSSSSVSMSSSSCSHSSSSSESLGWYYLWEVVDPDNSSSSESSLSVEPPDI